MNTLRRNKLINIREQLSLLKAEIEEVKDGEQESFDNMPENLQNSERGQSMEDNITIMDDIIDYLEQGDESITSLIDD